jgi:hypothetical protein
MKSRGIRFFLWLALILSYTKGFPQDPNFYIFLCFGQSNMEGQGTIEAQDRTVNSRLRVLEAVDCSNLGRTRGKWYTATPPLCRCYTGLSPADYFGKTLVTALPDTIKIGIVNVSVAGCKIELFDKNNYATYAATVETWMKNIISEYGGNPYGRLVEMAKLAQKDGVIRGILLHQGESNTGDTSWPAKVKGVYDNLIKDLGLTLTAVPLLAGEMVNADQGGVCASMNTIIAKLPQTIPGSYVISSAGCTDAADNVHFSSAGYRELGTRYGTKMASLLGYKVTVTGTLTGYGNGGYTLSQNFPNPCNGNTVISFEIPRSAFVSLKVYDTLGTEIAELAGVKFPAGRHTIPFKNNSLAGGIYIYCLTADQHTLSRKMSVLRN